MRERADMGCGIHGALLLIFFNIITCVYYCASFFWLEELLDGEREEYVVTRPPGDHLRSTIRPHFEEKERKKEKSR